MSGLESESTSVLELVVELATAATLISFMESEASMGKEHDRCIFKNNPDTAELCEIIYESLDKPCENDHTDDHTALDTNCYGIFEPELFESGQIKYVIIRFYSEELDALVPVMFHWELNNKTDYEQQGYGRSAKPAKPDVRVRILN